MFINASCLHFDIMTHGVMVKLLNLAACFVNRKVGGSNPLLRNTFTKNVFHYTLQLHGIMQHFLLPRDGSHLSAERSKFRMPNFLLFDVFRRTLKIPGENPAHSTISLPGMILNDY